jgi:dTMP kinase
MKKGKFIVIEGGDGAGKSTQIKMLKDYFGDLVVTTREPGGTPYAEAIRDIALKHPLAGLAGGKTQFLLMWASRAEHMFNKIKPALNDGKLVISDRFDSSTFAYNIFAQDEESLLGFFWETREFILRKNVPDLYLYLDVSPGVSKSRMSGRDEKNHFDERTQEFHEKVKVGFFKFFEKVPHVIIDADRTPEEVFDSIKTEIQKHL